MSHNERLTVLRALWLENMRHFIDATTVYKFLHGLVNFKIYDVVLHVTTSFTRGTDVYTAQQRTRNCFYANLYPIRAATVCYKIPIPYVMFTDYKNFVTCLV